MISILVSMKRVLVIIQLCFVFSTLCWYVGYPFMGELFELRTRMFIARTVTGDPDLLQYVSEKNKERDEKILEENRERYLALPKEKQGEILDEMGTIQRKMERSFGAKMKKGLQLVFFELPLLKRTWLFMALAISLGILFGIEGASLSAWVLPLIALGYFFFAEPAMRDPVEALYPKAEELPVGKNFEEQWDQYLQEKWGSPFAFNVALLDAYKERPKHSDQPLMQLIFFAWNLCFAYYVNYAKKTRYISMDSTCHTA